MTTGKKVGIWMDHASAHIIEYSNDSSEVNVIESKFTHQEKEHSLSKNENLMHNKEQHQQSEYYKKLGDVVLNYDEAILFGPTDAKSELHNILKDNHHFDKIKIGTLQADKMSDNERLAFVKNHFKNRFHSI